MPPNKDQVMDPSKSGKETSPSSSNLSMKEKQMKMESLNNKVYFLEVARGVLFAFIFALSGVSTGLLGIPDKVFGISLYSMLLASHFLFLWCLFIVHYKVFPPILDELCIISNETKGQITLLPAYHPSKNKMFWCHLRFLFPSLINVGIWIYLSYKDLEADWEDKDKRGQNMVICFFSGSLLLLSSFYALVQLDPLYGEPTIKKQNNTQRKQDTDMLEKDASYSKLLQEKDAFYIKLLQEKDMENERLRKENEEANNKTNGSPPKTKTPKKGNKSAGRSY
ncbi:hypothetical protein MOSE0_F00254 [Monosporozyma servazzii]